MKPFGLFCFNYGFFNYLLILTLTTFDHFLALVPSVYVMVPFTKSITLPSVKTHFEVPFPLLSVSQYKTSYVFPSSS